MRNEENIRAGIQAAKDEMQIKMPELQAAIDTQKWDDVVMHSGIIQMAAIAAMAVSDACFGE